VKESFERAVGTLLEAMPLSGGGSACWTALGWKNLGREESMKYSETSCSIF